jgi:hypothetical protein
LRYLLLKAKRMAVTNVEFITVHTVKKLRKMALPSDSRSEPHFLRLEIEGFQFIVEPH